VGNRLPHGLRRSRHWLDMLGGDEGKVNVSCYPRMVGVTSHFTHLPVGGVLSEMAFHEKASAPTYYAPPQLNVSPAYNSCAPSPLNYNNA
jgi:hypothetical protein